MYILCLAYINYHSHTRHRLYRLKRGSNVSYSAFFSYEDLKQICTWTGLLALLLFSAIWNSNDKLVSNVTTKSLTLIPAMVGVFAENRIVSNGMRRDIVTDPGV